MRFDHIPHRPGPAAVRGSDEVTIWRHDRLIDAGFAEPSALRLSVTPGVDLHALLNLVDRGCPPELAVRILGPLSDSTL
jgi:hypothetical protein